MTNKDPNANTVAAVRLELEQVHAYVDQRLETIDGRFNDIQAKVTQLLAGLSATPPAPQQAMKASHGKAKKKHAYAVVYYFNYRKCLRAGFLKGFDDLKEAIDHAYACAEEAFEEDFPEDENHTRGMVMCHEEIVDDTGPGKLGSPNRGKAIVGFCPSDTAGHSANIYCIVPWFGGVLNEWHDFEDHHYWKAKYGEEWYPRYSK
jgi:hypothetical protein